MDECELIIFISTIACTLSKCYTDDELSMLAAIFTQLGDSLSTILTKRNLCDKNTDMDNSNTL